MGLAIEPNILDRFIQQVTMVAQYSGTLPPLRKLYFSHVIVLLARSHVKPYLDQLVAFSHALFPQQLFIVLVLLGVVVILHTVLY